MYCLNSIGKKKERERENLKILIIQDKSNGFCGEWWNLMDYKIISRSNINEYLNILLHITIVHFSRNLSAISSHQGGSVVNLRLSVFQNRVHIMKQELVLYDTDYNCRNIHRQVPQNYSYKFSPFCSCPPHYLSYSNLSIDSIL